MGHASNSCQHCATRGVMPAAQHMRRSLSGGVLSKMWACQRCLSTRMLRVRQACCACAAARTGSEVGVGTAAAAPPLARRCVVDVICRCQGCTFHTMAWASRGVANMWQLGCLAVLRCWDRGTYLAASGCVYVLRCDVFDCAGGFRPAVTP